MLGSPQVLPSRTAFLPLLLLFAGFSKGQEVNSTGVSNSSAPFPNTTYPEAVAAYAQAGAHSNQTSPPFYPSPWGSGAGDWADAYAKARAFVSQLTLLEKVNLTTGVGWEGERCVGQTGAIPRMNFRSLCLQDSPLGVRDTDYNSVFPAGMTVAATWSRDLMYRRGNAMGSEHRDKGVDIQLGPVSGPLGRSPAGGRNWEGFSPDPVLTGIAMAETVRGIQDAGVIACSKHYIGNEQEHFRQAPEAEGFGYNITDSLSSNIDDRTMHELYLWPFADAVRAGTGSIMCSYNQINNSYGCQNSYTLNKLLKDELDFQGFVMSDWAAQHSGVSSALAGLDMTMPGDSSFFSGMSYWGANLTIAVLNGSVPEWRLDDMATRIMAAWYKVGRDKTQVPINFDSWTLDTFGSLHPVGGPKYGYGLINQHVDVRQEHASLIREIGAKAAVLLKNNNSALPLGKEKLTAVFGQGAGDNVYGPNGCPDRGCDNGTLGQGWGSGTANYPYLVTPLTAIQNEVLSQGGTVESVTNNYASSQIATLASRASVALVFVSADSGEGYISVDGNEGDRQNLTLWHGGEVLIQNISSVCNNTIVIISSVGPVLVNSFKDNPNVTAIIWAGLPGEQAGNSIADVLYGRQNPAGKLPFTIGTSRQDYGSDLLYLPNNGNGPPQANFEEGVFIDYRAFDRANKTPAYEFGFGLSYTTFAYSNLTISPRLTNASYPPPSPPGMTTAAPTYGNASANLSLYQFPANFTKVPAYIYPYLNNTSLPSGLDSSSSIPPHAHDSTPQPIPSAGGTPGGNALLYDTLYTVRALIRNTGSLPGEEVAQLYISLGGPDDPALQLRAFERLSILPGESTVWETGLTRRDLSRWDVGLQDWKEVMGARVWVGGSSRGLGLSATVDAMVVS